MSDFVSTDLITINVLGKEYKVKEMNGKEYDVMNSESMKYDSSTDSFKLDLSIKNIHYLKLVVQAPYPDFDKKDANGKVEMLNNLKPIIRKELINQIKKVIDSESDVIKK